jgi:hypothetical protein
MIKTRVIFDLFFECGSGGVESRPKFVLLFLLYVVTIIREQIMSVYRKLWLFLLQGINVCLRSRINILKIKFSSMKPIALSNQSVNSRELKSCVHECKVITH